MTTVKLIKIPPHIVTFFGVITPEVHSLSKFPLFNIVLITIAHMLYIKSYNLFILGTI